MLQSHLSWTEEESAPPVTKDIPDVARTPQVKWPECPCQVKYVSGLSKQCVQYSGGGDLAAFWYFWGQQYIGCIFAPELTCSVCHNLWRHLFAKCYIKVCQCVEDNYWCICLQHPIRSPIFQNATKQVHPSAWWLSLLETTNEVRAHPETGCPPHNGEVMTEEHGPLVPGLLWAICMCCTDSWWETKL